MNPNGLILWEGISAIDGVTPIVAVATGIKRATKNEKLSKRRSKVVQVWYLPRDTSPAHAVKTGDDRAVCGDCVHRPSKRGSCYVITFQAPQAVWNAYHRGSYAHWDGDPEVFRGRYIRFGAWGDPASVPPGTLDDIRDVAGKVSAYTHQWKDERFASLRHWVMASVDNVTEHASATLSGFRTFRIRGSGEKLLPGERQCPSADEAKTSEAMDCERCGGCNGLLTGAKRPSFSLMVHGRTRHNFDKQPKK